MGKEQDIGIDHVYVVHALRGYERHAERLQCIFGRQLGMQYELVTDGDPAVWSDELIYRYFAPDIKDILSDGTLSCTLNHILSYERMIAAGDKIALIMENDPCPYRNFAEQLGKIVQETQQLESGFMISLENSQLKFPPRKTIRTNRFLYPANAGRFAGAYLLDAVAAQRILEDLKTNKCARVIDWWHNLLIDNGVVKMYWAYPAIVEQGSHNGTMSAGISSKKSSIYRRIAWILQKTYKQYFLRLLR